MRKTLAALCLLLAVTPGFSHEERDVPRERERSGDSGGREERRLREDKERRADENRDKDNEESRSGRGGDSGKSPRELRDDKKGSGSQGAGRGAEARHGKEPRIDFERGARGHERIRAEVLMIARDREMAAVRSAGFTVLEEQRLSAAGEVLARVRVQKGMTVERAVQELQRLAPDASVAEHNLFRPSAPEANAAGAETVPVPVGSRDAPAVQLGVIDTGMAPVSEVLRNALVRTQAFATGGYVARAHGTVVGEVAARGGARLCSADVFGVDADNELAAPAGALTQAIDWMTASGVRVLNISIEGPDNPVLAHVIRRALAADIAIIAAAGNDGPAAAPVYPAAYPGVIAVTAVDAEGRIYRRANRGPHIAFAARGVNIPVTLTGSAPRLFSGTSFAAPVVAAQLLRHRIAEPGAKVPELILALRQQSRDLGIAGRDEIFGWGLVASPALSSPTAPVSARQ